jgi:hypothetical protein
LLQTQFEYIFFLLFKFSSDFVEAFLTKDVHADRIQCHFAAQQLRVVLSIKRLLHKKNQHSTDKEQTDKD